METDWNRLIKKIGKESTEVNLEQKTLGESLISNIKLTKET
jgi:hypothetical protein